VLAGSYIIYKFNGITKPKITDKLVLTTTRFSREYTFVYSFSKGQLPTKHLMQGYLDLNYEVKFTLSNSGLSKFRKVMGI
jgi:hypothetical protein